MKQFRWNLKLIGQRGGTPEDKNGVYKDQSFVPRFRLERRDD